MGVGRWDDIAVHRERLLVIARRRCPTSADAEDVVHEAMLRCAEFPDLDEERIGPFLTSVTVRLCADLYRSASRASRLLDRLAHTEPAPTDPEDEACAAADRHRLRALLASLPGRQRDLLVDRAAGLSVAQISRRHGLTYKATEAALFRARSVVRAGLTASLALGAVLWRRGRGVAVAAVPVAVLAVTAAVTGPGAPGGPAGGDPGERTGPGGAPAAAARVPAAPAADRATTAEGAVVGAGGAGGGRAAARPVRPAPRRTYLSRSVHPGHSLTVDDTERDPTDPATWVDYAGRCLRQTRVVVEISVYEPRVHQSCG